MSSKLRRLAVIYVAAALVALGGYSFAAARQLRQLRLTMGYESARAFEEAVTAVEDLSLSFKKLAYANDEALGKRLCAQACADALAAETALSVLPFPTQELEKLQGFLGRAGDYAGSLCALTDEELSKEHREHLAACGEAAEDFSRTLLDIQGRLHDGSITMDTRERRLVNIERQESPMLSALLLDYEGGFTAPAEFAYEGRYSPAQEEAGGTLSPEEAVSLAAKAAGVEPRELREEFDYAGPDGRRCYSAGGLLLGVSSRGLEFMGQSRLVSASTLTRDQARERAEAFLSRMGYGPVALYSEGGSDYVAVFRYAPTQEEIMRPDDALSISIAMDDGSVYAFDATEYRDRTVELTWRVDEEEALATLPEGVEAVSTRQLICKSPGGRYLPCWEISCTGPSEEGARILVDAETGRQWKIELGDA